MPVVVDDAATRVIGKAKALTSRSDLAIGVGQAVDAAIAAAASSLPTSRSSPFPRRLPPMRWSKGKVAAWRRLHRL